jgi:hypothetical protein
MKTENALLIFDPHQDADWIRRILAKEEGNFTHLLLGGDYFDAKSDRAGSIADMCELLLELDGQLGDDMTLLWGNHDIQYLETIPAMRRQRNPRQQKFKIPGDYSNSKAKKLSKLLPDAFLKRGKLFAEMNGHLISHAGLAKQFWPEAHTTPAALEELDQRCHKTLLTLPYHEDPLLQSGKCRGGSQPTGGITWLDFDHEFEDQLPLPQIFGHTPSFSERTTERARRKGRSWCLDGAQTLYGMLSYTSELDIRSL